MNVWPIDLVRSISPLEKKPGVISFLAGYPNSETVPITSLNFTTRSPEDPSNEVSMSLSPEALQQAFQYGPTAGMPQLSEWILNLQEREHGRNRGADWRLSVTNGSQDAIYKVRSVFLTVTLLRAKNARVRLCSCEPWRTCSCRKTRIRVRAIYLSYVSLRNDLMSSSGLSFPFSDPSNVISSVRIR